MKDDRIRKVVREGYAKVARKGAPCCSPAATASCCCSTPTSEDVSRRIGYSEEEMNSVPEGANLGLGCGNPVALASLKQGETVLDLGSGAGFDCFLAASKVGKSGKVIGVDMTPEMIDKARENKRKGNYQNVEFRLGEIENLPVADGTIDVVISNCVINLSPDKKRVFQEAFRVLRPGGRLMVSDIVLLRELPPVIARSIEAYVGCISGAELKDKYLKLIEKANFREIKVVEEKPFSTESLLNDPTAQTLAKNHGTSVEKAGELVNTIVSVRVAGIKPKL
jgi:ubiquinone/menaquinone biosynthesis C-methylase UbiE